MKNKLWVEKYRPNTVDGYVFTDDNQKNQVVGWIIGTPIDSNKEIIKVKASQTLGKVLKKFNMSEGAVSGCLRGTRNHHKGYTWTREEQDA